MPYAGQPQDTPIPPELNRWNWGAFLLNWIWGIGNSTYIAFLMFVPFVNMIMIFVLGAKGSKWAWKNRVWADADHFRRTQRNWAFAGLAVIAVFILLFGLIFTAFFMLMKSGDAYKLSLAQVRSNERVIAVMGEPIEAGWFMSGNVSVNGPQGSANLSIPISGPKNSGTVISEATKVAGVWRIHLLVVRVDGDPTPIVLINTKNLQIPNSAVES
ncbi:MAG: hypothetical protein HKN11_03015 [Rhizobiales bacterium]|nr:hypothetical protein [Hyphomicrobiales bacterium]